VGKGTCAGADKSPRGKWIFGLEISAFRPAQKPETPKTVDTSMRLLSQTLLVLLLISPVSGQTWYREPDALKLLSEFPGTNPREGARILEALMPGTKAVYDQEAEGFYLEGTTQKHAELLSVIREIVMERLCEAREMVFIEIKALYLKPDVANLRNRKTHFKRVTVKEFLNGVEVRRYNAHRPIWTANIEE